ncbi:recombinase family protein [Peribacillus butanolivorans]|uniref:recombinase family protein n=1 Tax=Peribacillus butanolivorans TaxID=421767 RepID=UPI003662BE2B
MRSAPYGYDYINGTLVINKDEAVYVRKIYDWYLNGVTLREIGEKLFQEGAIPKQSESKNFGASSIRRILSSEIYIGNYVYNKRETKKVWGERTASGKQKKTFAIRDESDWIRVDVPAIIDENIYTKAQNQKVKNTRKCGNVTFQYLFKGMIRCKHCGRIWECTTYNGRADKKTGERKKYPVYRCPNLNPKRYGDGIEKCESKSIRVELLDTYIMNLIYESLSDPKLFEEAIKARMTGKDDTLDTQLMELEKQLKHKTNERDRVKRMYVVAQVITEDEMLSDMKNINREITKITGDIDKLNKKKENEENNEISDEIINQILTNIEIMFKDNDSLSFESRRKLMELLIEEIVVVAKSEQVGITVKGPLDNIASWTQRQEDGKHSAEAFQIISPYRGEAFGTESINQLIQDVLNGSYKTNKGNLGGVSYFDKVIQYKNRPKSNPYWAYNMQTKSNERFQYL